MAKTRVAIVGGGPAGLTAAYELLKEGGKEKYDVTLLESSDQFGGISRTVKYDGQRMDIGGHRFFSKDQRIMDWWQNILPLQGAPAYDDKKLHRPCELEPGGPDPEKTDQVMLIRHRLSRVFWHQHFFDYPITLSGDTIKAMGPALTLKAGLSYLESTMHKLPETNLENFYINRFGRVLYSLFFEGYTEKLWGRHPSEISADWGAQRVKGLSITAVLKNAVEKMMPSQQNRQVETSLIEKFWYPKLGPGELWETVAQKVTDMGGKIIMNAKVNRFSQKDGKVDSLSYLAQDGQEVELKADQFMSSMPLKNLLQAFNNSETKAPEDITEIAYGLPYRDFVTVGLLCKRLKLKNTTTIRTLGEPPIVPDNWIYVQDPGYKVGRIQIFNNWSPYLVSKPDDTVWIGLEYFTQQGDDFWNLSDQQAKNFAIKEMIRMQVLYRAEDVLDFHRERVPKAYPAYFDTYERMDELKEWLDHFGNLYCIGRNGQHHYNNQDHSMACAMEAVSNIKTGKTSKVNVWNVNTEKAYHESK